MFLYIHKLRFLFLEVLKVAKRNTRGKTAGKETGQNDTPVFNYFPSTSNSCESLLFTLERLISVLLTFQISITTPHFNLAQNLAIWNWRWYVLHHIFIFSHLRTKPKEAVQSLNCCWRQNISSVQGSTLLFSPLSPQQHLCSQPDEKVVFLRANGQFPHLIHHAGEQISETAWEREGMCLGQTAKCNSIPFSDNPHFIDKLHSNTE